MQRTEMKTLTKLAETSHHHFDPLRRYFEPRFETHFRGAEH